MKLILAIDDDNNTLKLLESQLKNLGFQIITARTGAKGIELAESGHPNLILLDIMMPELNGFDVLKSLKRNRISRDIPIIMLTSKSKKEDITQAIRMGVTDYITKPYDKITLAKKVSAALMENESKKAQNTLSESEHFEVIRRNGRVLIQLKGKLAGKIIINQALQIFNKSFFTLTKYDDYILDLRNLPEFSMGELPILLNLMKFFENKQLMIIGGRHYGIIIANLDLPENIHIFISFGDVELFLDKK